MKNRKKKKTGVLSPRTGDSRSAANPRQRPGTEANFRAESLHPWSW